MPAQKRSSNHRQHNEARRKQSRGGGSAIDQPPTSSSSSTLSQSPLQHHHQQQTEQQEQHPNEQQQEDQPAVCDQDPAEETQQDDSEGSGTDPEEFDEIITVLRSELRNNVQCPICLGIIKKTRTVMGCLHRFCRECIDKSMRLGNNECPACRIHCASRRSLRDDQDFDSLIEAIYPDAEKYEEEELVFCEEDKTRNEQIQASIEEISRRQSEALNKKRKSGKEVDDSSSQLQLPRSCYNAYTRRRKKNQKFEVDESDDNGKHNDIDGIENPSSSGNHGTETKRKMMRKNRKTGVQPSMCISLRAVRKPENLTWGSGGARSHRISRASPLFKLIDCIEGVEMAETETDMRSTSASLENNETNVSMQVIEPKLESPEKKVATEGVEPVASTKRTKTENETADNSETSKDVPNSSSPNDTQPNVGPQILDRKENPEGGVGCHSQNNTEQLISDMNHA